MYGQTNGQDGGALLENRVSALETVYADDIGTLPLITSHRIYKDGNTIPANGSTTITLNFSDFDIPADRSALGVVVLETSKYEVTVEGYYISNAARNLKAKLKNLTSASVTYDLNSWVTFIKSKYFKTMG